MLDLSIDPSYFSIGRCVNEEDLDKLDGNIGDIAIAADSCKTYMYIDSAWTPLETGSETIYEPINPLNTLTNCPNCGAPVKDDICPYCGTKHLRI